MNLLKELKDVLEEHGKTLDDIKWVGSEDYKVDVNKFLELADVEYDEAYGASEVAENLIIVGNGWHLDREEYHSSEWFEFHTLLSEPTEYMDLKALTVDQYNNQNPDKRKIGWETLEELNMGDSYETNEI